MTGPHRRPRDKGGTDPRSAAATSFESSNQTMAMFLGGTPKSWMTGHQVTNDLLPLSSHKAPRTTSIRQGTASQARTSGSSIHEPDDGSSARALQCSATDMMNQSIASENPLATITNVIPATMSKDAPGDRDAVLPSPAPSDEPRQASAPIIDLEEETEPPPHLQARNGSEDVSDETRLVELAARYGGIEGLEKRLSNAVPTIGLTDSAENGSNLLSLDGVSYQMNVRPAEQHEAPSNNGTQQEPTLAAVGLPTSATPDLMRIGPNMVSTSSQMSPQPALPDFSATITQRLQAIRATQHMRQKIEVPRLGLLEDACHMYDFFYLIMHQIFCVGTVSNLTNAFGMHAATQRYADGFMRLTHLLLSNDELPNDAISWFMTFPLPVTQLLENWPSLRNTHEKVLECLLRLPREWENLSSDCHRRCYPPLVDEMTTRLGVLSWILQRVMCRAILREIWVGPKDACHNQVERLFRQNEQEVAHRGPQPIPIDALTVYNQRLAMKYQYLWAQHRSHLTSVAHQPTMILQQGSLSNLGTSMSIPLPQQANLNSTRARSANAYSDMTQPIYPAPMLRGPTPLHIDTQSVAHTLANFRTTPTVPSSVVRSPIFQNSPLSGVSRTNDPMSNRYRQPPGQDLGAPAFSDSPSPQNPIEHRSSIPNLHHSPISTLGPASTISPLQPFFNRQWNPQSARVNSSQQQRVSPVIPRPGYNSPTGRNTTLQFGTSISSRTPSQPQSAYIHASQSIPSQFSQSQLAVQQSPVARNLASVSQSPARPLFPPPGHINPIRDATNSLPAALHQVHVRSPVLVSLNAEGKVDNKMMYFSFVSQVMVMPQRLTAGNRHFQWTFEVDAKDFRSLAQSFDGLSGAPSTRFVRLGSRTFRIRCVKVSGLHDLTESEWLVAETFWPDGIAILINHTTLELRKRWHHGKDLPADITKHIMEGTNTFSVAITRPKQNEENVAYAFVMETIETIDADEIRAKIQKLEAKDSLQRIAATSTDLDPDIEVVNRAVIIDLTDPFTLNMWKLPVRGKTCRHYQCFDLLTFLNTRGNKAGQPCTPERFKCPICKADARPQMLLTDLFLSKIREDLEQMNRLDVKEVILDDQGTWKIQEPEKDDEFDDDDGEGSGDQKLPRHRHSGTPGESEIIEIDDD